MPAACSRSARLTALAATSISTSPGPATGSGDLGPAQLGGGSLLFDRDCPHSPEGSGASAQWLPGLWGQAPAGRLRRVMPPERTIAEFWPIFGLRLATPRLIADPVQDDDLVETST